MAEAQAYYDRYRKRLQHARRVWEHNGFIGSNSSSPMRYMLDFYRGDHWKHPHVLSGWFGALDGGDLVTVNKIYSTVNASVANLGARNPKTEVRARNRDDEAARRASIFVQSLLDYDVKEQNFLRQWNLALKDHHFAPFGCVRHGFTPAEEFYDDKGRSLSHYRPAAPDRPWMKRLPIWDVLLDTRRQLHNDGEMRWCAFRDLMTVDEIRRTPGMIARDNLAPNVSQAHRDLIPKHLLSEEDEDVQDLVEVYTVYEVDERTWFQMTVDDGIVKPLRERAEWPIPWEWLPIDILAIHEQPDDPFAKALIEEGIPIQIELNRVRTIMGIIARNTRRIIVYSDSLPEAEASKLEDAEVVEILKTAGADPRLAIAEIKAGGFPQELITYEEILNRDIREVMGQSKFRRAQRENVESATEATFIQQGEDALAFAEQDGFETFIRDSLRNYWHGRQATMTQDEMVPILGPDVAAMLGETVARIRPQDITGDFMFEIRAGSTLPDDMEREARKALADLQVAGTIADFVNMDELIRDYYYARRKDPARYLKTPEERQQASQARTLQQQSSDGKTPSMDPQAFISQGGGVQ